MQPIVTGTKIIATLGPSTSAPEPLMALHKAGASIFRLNFSHGSHQDHAERIQNIRDLERQLGRPMTILADLQGPKLRVGKFKEGAIQLTKGASFRLDLAPKIGDAQRVSLPHPEILTALSKGDDLLLDDGKLRLRVTEAQEDYLMTEVIIGGTLSDHKGVNIPGVVLPLSPLTDKDRDDLTFALSEGVDWVALSFVQRASDIDELKALVAGRAQVMAKLEKPSAIDDLEEIAKRTDAIMVARGDLGVEMPPETVPILQRRILNMCRTYGIPAVVATQMLDSMVDHPTPTRAEASDVATAVYNGADAVMLSAETAIGAYPVETVAIMQRIIDQVQHDPNYWTMLDAHRPTDQSTTPDAISQAARQMAETLPASAIVAYTSSGSTALKIARERPHSPIIALTPKEQTARQLNLVWGVHSARVPDANDMKDMEEIAAHQAKIDGFATETDRLVVTAGLPFGTPGKTNLIRILRV